MFVYFPIFCLFPFSNSHLDSKIYFLSHFRNFYFQCFLQTVENKNKKSTEPRKPIVVDSREKLVWQNQQLGLNFGQKQKYKLSLKNQYLENNIQKSREGVLWWRTRDSLSHVSQWSDSQKNQGVSQISQLFQILIFLLARHNTQPLVALNYYLGKYINKTNIQKSRLKSSPLLSSTNL